MKIPEKAFYLVIIVLLISVGTLGWLLKQKTQTIVEKETLIQSLTDTLRITTNVKGQQVATISQLRTSKVKDFLKIKTQDEVIKRLQAAVVTNKGRLGNSGSVTVFSTDTKVSTIVPTNKVIPKDTIFTNSITSKVDTIKIYPEYKTNITLGKWVSAGITSNKDSTGLELLVHNEYTSVIGEEPIKGTGFLGMGKKLKPFSEITNLNPYSETKVLRTYSVESKIKPKRLSLGLQSGYNPIINKWYWGAGIQYNLANLF